MTILSIINLKGGVAKTISAVNIAHILATVHGFRVLLIDNDKQGNTTKFYGLHDTERHSIAKVLTEKGFPIKDAIRQTKYDRLDVLPSNMDLLHANKQILTDSTRPQQTRLKKSLAEVSADYDYVIIDNAPDLDMAVINALVASNHVLIPIKVDQFAFDGVAEILGQVEDLREFNETIHVMGGFVTMYQNTCVNRLGAEDLYSHDSLPMLKTKIRRTVVIDETTFEGKPLLEYAPKNKATQDYIALVAEYLNMCQ